MASRKSAIDMLPLTPTKLGRYEIVDEIGKGAMGVVFLARDPLIGRLVALKTFRIGYSIKDQELEQFRIRFMREAQSAGILTHPHIVTIHDVVEASDEGLAFIAMEYVRGTNLKLLLQGDQPMPLATALDVVSQVGDALDYAHANRVIHRDVKPANILITTENRVKITDFGIARLESSNLTQEGQLLGTPNYMAPEQIQGREVDHRSDLFSLGVVLYEMLTRHKPFQGENLTVVSHRIVYDHFTPPREYVRDLPAGVDRILARALEKDPARRYQRAKEMVDDLRQVVETTSVRPDVLNETQSLSSTMVLPPPLPPPPFAAAAAAAAADAGAEAPDLSDTVATELPVLSPPRRRPSPRRLLAVGGITLAAALLLGTALLLWASWSQPAGRQRDAKEDSKRALVLALLHQGNDERVRGNWLEAAALFHQADLIAPGRRGIQSMRRTAEAKSQIPQQPVVNLAQQIDFGLQGAKQALEAKNYEAAASMAGGVLIMDAENANAKTLLAKAQEGMTRKNKRPTPANPRTRRGDQQAAAVPTSSEAPPARPASSAPTEARTATLHVRFKADVADGVLILWMNDQELWRDPFSSRGGLLSHFRKQGEGHHENGTALTVPAGGLKLRVQMSSGNKPAVVKYLNLDLPGGGSRSVEIHFSSSGQLSLN
jgi:serine/threonine protein kinase